MKNTKYIFVTGGVVSSLGKGVTSASIGCLLKAKGLKVNMLKFDPYLNVDPGTMSPYQHGEVFVTSDGVETDLDLGHYERFLNQDMTRYNNITAGQIYESIINKERAGKYLGKTVQVVPHVTDEIKEKIKKLADNSDVVITELGGTVGDIEGLPFLEAIRQFRQDVGKENVIYVHITYIPYIRAAEELKTKPTQHSVMKLREIGIEPDIIICRTEYSLSDEIKGKIALFCNVEKNAVIEEKDVGEFVYKIPIMLHEENLDNLLLKKLNLKARKSNLSEWKKMVENYISARDEGVKIAIAGKYTELRDAYKSILEALLHVSAYLKMKIKIEYFATEDKNLERSISHSHGVIVPGGFGERGIEGKIKAINIARIKKLPFFGICLGMQCAVIEFARNVLKLPRANSTEFDPKTPYPVIDLLPEQRKIKQLGGTMRLGIYPCKIRKDSIAFEAYRSSLVYERHRHRYELNNKFRDMLNQAGLKITGEYEEKKLAEIIELENHPWFLGTQFHPEFQSRPLRPHPLFIDFVKACIKYKKSSSQ